MTKPTQSPRIRSCGFRHPEIRPADNDVLGIIALIGEKEGPEMAKLVLENIVKTRKGLSPLQERGCIPPEMKRVNILSYREIQADPYRAVYQVNKEARPFMSTLWLTDGAM